MPTAPRVNARKNQDLKRYILPTEKVVVATRLHWASLLEPAATTVGVFLFVALVVTAAPRSVQPVAEWLWVLWFAALGRFVFRWFEWRHEWFVATDRRLLLLYGLVIHKVAMMPLTKVTDMGYSRTPAGQILGYGRFVMESAGQDQALRQVDHVPQPDATYRVLCSEIFRPQPARDPARPGTGADGATAWPPVVVPGRPAPEPRHPTTQPIPVVGSGPTPPPPPPSAHDLGWDPPPPYDSHPR
ncbi:PH domain-containing protein [Xylanimonas allomyrinae]|uniref:PH domain-containing protein n=1 Tax=Xylanimonas allomyrinae TaxID=2509459 RepID=A0A4P6EL93_9MICO|nr:PH domain-containing protein [Xylanimonas allomyrinae]QAY63135.1 PH domain-containing protein [Xylanimonas allomyrinae]